METITLSSLPGGKIPPPGPGPFTTVATVSVPQAFCLGAAGTPPSPELLLCSLLDILGRMRSRQLTASALQTLLVMRFSRREECNLKSLACEMGFTNAGVTYIVDQMEKLGLARRMESAGDRRQTLVELTPAGRECIGWIAGTG